MFSFPSVRRWSWSVLLITLFPAVASSTRGFAEESVLESAAKLREARGAWSQIVKLRGERQKLADRIAAIRPIVAGQKDPGLRAKNERLLSAAENELAKMDASLIALRQLLQSHAELLKLPADADDAAIEGLLKNAEAKHPGSIRIGKVGVIGGEVWQTDLFGVRKRLEPGSEVRYGAEIATGPTGRITVLLEDETCFTVGADSIIRLDEFVYDPVTTPSKIVAQVTKGVFRYVTGKVANNRPTGAKIVLPSGTVGIRGTEFLAEVAPSGDAVVTLISGAVDVTLCQSMEVVVVSAGSQISLSSDGQTFEIKKVDAQALSAAWEAKHGVESADKR